jgi:hypothetical protein
MDFLPDASQVGKVLVVDGQGNVNKATTTQIGDHLGNHTCTQNIKLGNYWLSNDGSNYGLKVDSLGDVWISGRKLGGNGINSDVVIKGPSSGTMEDNSFEIVTRGRKPIRRGISIEEYPSGDMNFWLHSSLSPAAFNFMYNISGGMPKKLASINKNGDVYVSGKVGVGITNPSSPLEVKLPAGVSYYSRVAAFKSQDGKNNVFIVPQLCSYGYNPLSRTGDIGIFWTDSKGSGQKNVNAGFVLAPWSEQGVGMKITKEGKVGIGIAEPTATLAVNGDAYVAGKVGIGTATPQYELDVRGTGHFCTLKVKTQGWCDYVFDESYTLLPLEELEQYIKLHKKLPDIPSENDVNTNGIDVASMNKILTKKIEELTLYIIELNKRIEKLEKHEK